MKNLALPSLKNDGYTEKLIPWLPDEAPKPILIRSFENALRSLLQNTDLVTEENLSFPNKGSPFKFEQKPVMTLETPITELHHGSLWIDT